MKNQYKKSKLRFSQNKKKCENTYIAATTQTVLTDTINNDVNVSKKNLEILSKNVKIIRMQFIPI